MSKIKECGICGKVFEDKYRDGKRFCGRKCAAKYRAKTRTYYKDVSGSNNPNWKGSSKKKCLNCKKELGVKVYTGNKFCDRKCYSENKKKNNLNSIVCPTCRKTFNVLPHDVNKRKFCSLKCFHTNINVLENRGLSHKGKCIPEWHRQAVSKSHSNRNPETLNSYGKSGHYNSQKGGKIFYRSSYELAAYKILDSNDQVFSFKSEPVTITYKNKEGLVRRYRPDILVIFKDGSSLLVEVKPKWKLNSEDVKLKLSAGKKYARKNKWKFKVWTEKDLGFTK